MIRALKTGCICRAIRRAFRACGFFTSSIDSNAASRHFVEKKVTIVSNRPLTHPLVLKPGLSPHVIRTIGDAAMFITNLPKDNNDGKLHWRAAGSYLEAAHRKPDDSGLLDGATRSVENALRTEGTLA
jgi:hypothetical protein